jgi:hypothetical protein
MLVCVLLCVFARETAGAACTRLSLRPLPSEGQKFAQTSDASRRENAASYPLGCLKIESEIWVLVAGFAPVLILGQSEDRARRRDAAQFMRAERDQRRLRLGGERA